MELKNLIVMLIFLLVVASIASAGEIIYVDNDASVGGDGLSWSTAFKYLQDGLAAASYGDEIRVAQGSYKPDLDETGSVTPGNREETFQLISGVAIKGGYGGLGKPDPNKRDTKVYETILSGDLNGDDGPNFANNDENSYHVVTGSNIDETAVLDGFTITAGNADGSLWPSDAGGGIMLEFGSPTVLNCIFSGNSATFGGGMSSMGLCNMTFTNCTFSNNFAASGGGMAVMEAGNPEMTNCTFAGNIASQHGGGVCITLYAGFASTFDNCIFIGNQAGNDGGAYYTTHDSPAFTNCTFTGNSADKDGGASCFWGNTELPRFINCIIWDNTAYGEGPQIAIKTAATVTVNYCDVQGGELDVYVDGAELIWDTNSNIDDDPCFADADNDDYHLKSQAGRWDPNSESWVTDDVTSPCIDAGDPNSDWTAELWPHGKLINMGMYGGTAQASMSLSDAGNIADLDANDVVNYADLKLFTDGWLRQQVLLSEDLDRNSSVNFKDFAIFADNWSWEQ